MLCTYKYITVDHLVQLLDYWLDEWKIWIQFPAGTEIWLFSKATRLTLGPINLLRWVHTCNVTAYHNAVS